MAVAAYRDLRFQSNVMSATRASSTPVRVRLMRRVVVWGTGNMGSTAIRSTLAFPGLELAAVITSAPDKAGRDAATFAGLTEDTGVLATASSRRRSTPSTIRALRPRIGSTD